MLMYVVRKNRYVSHMSRQCTNRLYFSIAVKMCICLFPIINVFIRMIIEKWISICFIQDIVLSRNGPILFYGFFSNTIRCLLTGNERELSNLSDDDMVLDYTLIWSFCNRFVRRTNITPQITNCYTGFRLSNRFWCRRYSIIAFA